MICVIGSLNMDLVVTSKEIPKVGETLIGERFDTIPGGKGANQAVAASRMGAKTFMVGKLGSDVFASELRKSLEDSHVNCRHIYEEAEIPSGVALISVNERAGNSIIVVPGANYAITKADIDRAIEVIRNSTIVVLQHEIPLETVAYSIGLAKQEGKITVLNPAPAYELEDSVLKNIDFLIPNEHELSTIAQMKTDTEEEQICAAKALIQRGVQHVIVTLGDKGCLYVNANDVRRYPARTVVAVDSTAAGDSFIGGFCAVYERERDVERSIEMGQKAAALSVTRKGAQTSIPTMKDIQDFWS